MKKTILLLVAFLITSVCFSQVTYSVGGATPTILAGGTIWTNSLISSIPAFVPTTIYVNEHVFLKDNITIPNNITLKFLSGAIITLRDYNLTINGPIDADAFQIFNCNGKGETLGYPLIERAFPQWWKVSHTNLEIGQTWIPNWDNAIQRAVDFYPIVFFPALDGSAGYYIKNSIKIDLSRRLPSGYILSGVGRGSYFETNFWNGDKYGDFVFKCINVPDGGYRSGLTFENLAFFCQNGIAVANCVPDSFGVLQPEITTEKFSNEKKAILNVKINNCSFQYNDAENNDLEIREKSIAILFIKAFDSEVSKNYIDGYGFGVKMLGADLNLIRDNRIINFYKHCIFERSYTDFIKVSIGSQNAIIHNDLLNYLGKDDENAFIKSNSNHIEIKDNYLEQQYTEDLNKIRTSKKLFAYIDCTMYRMDVDDKYDTNYSHGVHIPPHYSYHLDITGNRCDAFSTTTHNIYFFDEKFRSLNLVEIPNFTIKDHVFSDFATITDEDNDGIYDATRVTHIPLKIKLQWEEVGPKNDTIIRKLEVDKLINMKNCLSFRDWANFSTSNVFSNNSNGDIVIDSKSISFTSRVYDYTPPLFSPRSFRIAPGNTSSHCENPNDCPGFFIMLDQKQIDSDLGDMFTKFNILLKVRNIGNDEKVADDLFLRIDDITDPNCIIQMYRNNSIDVPSDTDSTWKNYHLIRIVLPEDLAFNSNHYYRLAITSKSSSTKEFKEIILEHTDKLYVDSDSDCGSECGGCSSLKETKSSHPIAQNNTAKNTNETVKMQTVKVVKDAKENTKQNNLTIDIQQGNIIKSIEICNEKGVFIADYTKKLSINNILDISDLPSATYLVKVTTVANNSKIKIKNN